MSSDVVRQMLLQVSVGPPVIGVDVAAWLQTFLKNRQQRRMISARHHFVKTSSRPRCCRDDSKDPQVDC